MSTGTLTAHERLTVSVGEKIYTQKVGRILSLNICFRADILLVIKASTRDNCQNLVLKVHKIENFFGSDFEFCTISLLLLLKY